jgi:hypothetical protein
MMSNAQQASHAGAAQNVTSRAAGTAVRAGASDAAAIAGSGAAARPAASATSSAMASTSAPVAPAPEATAGSEIRVRGVAPVPAAVSAAVSARAAVPAPAAPPALSSTAAHSPTWQANLARLEGLAEVLNHHGLRARLITPPGRVPSLHVVNPSAAALAEDVYAGRGQDGLWWFWWSWAERITVGEDLEGAASMIVHVLAASS